MALIVAVLLAIIEIRDQVNKSENSKVVLIREYVRARKQDICPSLKVKTRSSGHNDHKRS